MSESTKSYFKNINTHLAYEDFREQRKKLRMSGEMSGLRLADYLTSYSERKQDYVDDVKKIIESNNFMKFDNSGFAN